MVFDIGYFLILPYQLISCISFFFRKTNFILWSIYVVINQLVEQDLLNLPEHKSSSHVLVGFELLNLQFYVYVLQIVICPFVLFHLAISYILYQIPCCLFFFDLRILITPLVSSNSSKKVHHIDQTSEWLSINKTTSYRLCMVSSTYDNIFRYHIQRMPTNILQQVLI